MEYILQTDNLSKIYGAKTVLDHVSIHVPKKSIYGLVGKNGAGKTTLMRIICGLTQQSEGSYTLLGKSNDAVVRKNMGMLIEKPGIYEHMTALENLRYFSLLFGIQSKDHHRILEMVGLQNAGKKKASQFSLGMKQRLGIAISLLGNPDFLILDEPINGLDPEGVYEIRKMLESLNREHGTTIMIASHILSELHKLATHYAPLLMADASLMSLPKKRWSMHAAAASRLRLNRNTCKMQKHSLPPAIPMSDVKFSLIKACICMRKSIRRILTNSW